MRKQGFFCQEKFLVVFDLDNNDDFTIQSNL